jgi:hypothetical protein
MDRIDQSGVPTPPPAPVSAPMPDHSLYRSVETTVAHAAQLRVQLAAHADQLSARTAAILGGAE